MIMIVIVTMLWGGFSRYRSFLYNFNCFFNFFVAVSMSFEIHNVVFTQLNLRKLVASTFYWSVTELSLFIKRKIIFWKLCYWVTGSCFFVS